MMSPVLLAAVAHALTSPSLGGARASIARRSVIRLSEAPSLPGEGNTTARSLQVGESAALEELGPVVVTEDGQLRYIDNWAEMTPEEQEATQRIISKRNAARLKKLRGGSSTALASGTVPKTCL